MKDRSGGPLVGCLRIRVGCANFESSTQEETTVGSGAQKLSVLSGLFPSETIPFSLSMAPAEEPRTCQKWQQETPSQWSEIGGSWALEALISK